MKLVNESITDVLKGKSKEEIDKIPVIDKYKARYKNIFSEEEMHDILIKLIKSFEKDGRKLVSHSLRYNINNESTFKYTKPNLLNALGDVIPWFIDQNPELNYFWEDNHAYWSDQVIVLRDKEKNHIFLASLDDGKIIKIDFKIETID